MTEHAAAPLTRRALRAAASQVLEQASAAAPQVPTPTPAVEPPLTRRSLREAERARTTLPAMVAVVTPASAAGNVPTQRSALHAAPRPAPEVPRPAATVPTQSPAPARDPMPAATLPTQTSSVADQPAVPAHTPAVPLPVVDAAPATYGPTRRELRLAAHGRATGPGSPEICRPPFAASLVLPAHQVRGSQARAVISRLGAKPLAVVALSVTMLVGGVSQVHAEQSTVAAEIAAERAERVERAGAARNAAQAAAFAVDKRVEALAVAEQAVGAAEGVQAKAATVVDQEKLAALEKATAELTALLESAPAVEALSAVVEPEAPAPAPTTAADAPASTDTVEAPAELLAATPQPSPARDKAASRAGAVAADGRAPVAERVANQSAPAAAAVRTSDPAVLEQQLAALDIDTSTKILAAATAVAALSAEVEATADTVIAELEQQRAAEEAARVAAEEAARKAAEEAARKVSVVKSSPNGQIPADVLCGVGFQEGVQLRCDAAAALERLNAAYKAEFGRSLQIVSSYRSYAAQISTKRTRGYLAATPGTSNHGHGIAVDFGNFGGVGQFGSANHRWVRAHGPEFGWHHPEIMRPGGGGPQEPWHFEFEG